MYDGRFAASKIISMTNKEIWLVEEPLCAEDRFRIVESVLYYHPKNHKEAKIVLEAYNQLRTSPLVKALE